MFVIPKDIIRGAVFDFNGTMLWDTQIHNQAWDIFLQKYHISLNDDEKNHLIHGKTNEDIFKTIFNDNLDIDLIHRLSGEKEEIYRYLCIEQGIDLAEGLAEFLKECFRKNIKMAIATSANKSNVDFYLQRYDLLRWFELANIIFNDGNMKSKPDPEIFNLAIQKLGVNRKNTVIFEDSRSGIRAAIDSGVSTVVIINSNQDNHVFDGCITIDSFFEVKLE